MVYGAALMPHGTQFPSACHWPRECSDSPNADSPDRTSAAMAMESIAEPYISENIVSYEGPCTLDAPAHTQSCAIRCCAQVDSFPMSCSLHCAYTPLDSLRPSTPSTLQRTILAGTILALSAGVVCYTGTTSATSEAVGSQNLWAFVAAPQVAVNTMSMSPVRRPGPLHNSPAVGTDMAPPAGS